MSAIFDTSSGDLGPPPRYRSKTCLTFSNHSAESCTRKSFSGNLPDFLLLCLLATSANQKAREWKPLHDRVILNDELDLSEFANDAEHAKFTLYGFMVQAGGKKLWKVLCQSSDPTAQTRCGLPSRTEMEIKFSPRAGEEPFRSLKASKDKR